MDLRQAGLGIVIFILFWAFQANYFANLGYAAWIVGLVIFEVILWLIGKGVMPKQSNDMKQLWMYVFAFALISTIIVSYGGMLVSGYSYPSSNYVLAFWLVLFGAAMLLTGWQAKFSVTMATGFIWLFSSSLFMIANMPTPYFFFGLLTALPFVLVGLMEKSRR